LTGELPGKKIAPPSTKVQIDVRLDEVVLRALEKNPELRYQQVSEVKTCVETIVNSGSAAAPAAPVDAPSNATPTNKSPLARILEVIFDIKFTSPLALKLINLSALGFLGFLGSLGYMPLPGWQRCFAFAGFFGLFGLIGFAFMVEFWNQRRLKQAANEIPPDRPQVQDSWPQVNRATALRLLAVVVVQLALFETLQQLSVHWRESTEELWSMGLMVATLGGLVWACWPGWRMKRSVLFVIAGTIASAVLLLALDNFYSWNLRPNLGLYREADWVAQHPGFQQILRERLGLPGYPAQPTAEVTGTVTDALTGKPIAGARVDDNFYGALPSKAPQQAWTDASGKFTLKTWPEEHNIAASAPGYETKLATLTTSLFGGLRESRMDFRLQSKSTAAAAEAGQMLVEQPPVVVETFPVSGARDVEPGEAEIRVRFSKTMTDGSWSWSTTWENSTPEFIGQPHYESDSQTCVIKAKLEPGRTYAFWLNSEKFQNFKDSDGRPAVPYLLIFQTKQK
ncbi:MAG TPA: carboxypeptidase regulatory-like domain-containing protein, partial [Verrucomicrobiae bacterium]